MDEARHKKKLNASTLVLPFGKPIPYETFDRRHTPMEWAQLVKDHVYVIAEDPEKEFSFIKN